MKNVLPEFHFLEDLKKIEAIVNSLPKEQAFELISYTASHFRLIQTKKMLTSPTVDVKAASDILRAEMELWLKRKIFNSAFKKVNTWIRLIELVYQSVKI
jgi:hypothetical protein